MFLLFGPIINKILCDIHQNISNSPQRCFALFKRSKEKEQHHTSPYIIVRATKDDYKPIIELAHEAFYPDEPTSLSLGLNKSPVMDEYTLRGLTEGISLVAKCKYDGCLAGASVNVSGHPWDPDLKEKLACNVSCPKTKQILLFLAYAQRLPNLWKCYNTNKIFEISQLFVAKEHRKKGLAKRLVQESRSLAADCGFQLVRYDATGAYAAEMCEKLNLKLIASIPYCSYIGKNMEPVFRPPHPHEAYKIYVDEHPQLTERKKKKK